MKRAFGVRDLDQFTSRLAELRLELPAPLSPGEFVAHTDGACLGNPEGPGGWAAVVEPGPDGVPWLLWGHLSSTSNNRAEALGVLAAMEWVPEGSTLTVRSDSELTVRILQGRYKAKANPDIWQVITTTRTAKRLTVAPEWLRGHAGDPRNELADRLSKLGATDGVIDDLEAITVPPPPEVPQELAGLQPQGDWEREFLRSVARQLSGKKVLSPKQQAIVDRIRARGASS